MAAATGAVKVTNAKGVAAVAKVKVQRYWAGRAPKGAPGAGDAHGDDSGDDGGAAPAPAPRARRAAPVAPETPQLAASTSDPRLLRLLRAKEEREEGRKIQEGEVVVRRRPRRDEDEDEPAPAERPPAQRPRTDVEAPPDEDEDARRERLRRQAREARLREEEELARAQAAAEGSESEYESEYEEVEEEEEADAQLPPPLMLKPIFVPKSARVTVDEREQREREEEEAQKRKVEQAQKRREETHRIVADEVKREMEEGASGIGVPLDKGDPATVDDGDGVNEEEEYEHWKLRELKRLKRHAEEVAAAEHERAETERRRNMTDAERREEDRNDPAKQPKSKPKLTFMQKYWHKGAFFQDQEILKRDYSAPTERDSINKELLPAPMRVKNFGRSGQTKYTHLVDQDTSTRDAGWAQKNHVTHVSLQKLAGYKSANDFGKPTGSKRR